MTVPQPLLVSLNIGAPKHLGTNRDGTPFVSSIAREAVDHPIRLGMGGFEGDACHWSGHHSEPMAVNVFAIEDYPYYEKLGGKTFPRPAFGENLTLSGYTDEDARIGDVLRVGTALLQVSQPRIPCGNVVRFHELPKIVRWMEEACRTGFYLRVLETGEVGPDSALEVVERGELPWTIARLSGVMYGKTVDEEAVERLQEVECLSPNWKSSLIQRIRRVHASSSKGAAPTS